MEKSYILQLQQPHLGMGIFPSKQHVGGVPFLPLKLKHRVVPMIKVKASACSEFSSTFNGPLEQRSHAGKFLSSVWNDHPGLFRIAATEELKKLSFDRDSAVSRMLLSKDSDEALLHRRIAELKQDECRIAIQDIMYLLILYKFTKLDVCMVPKLSSCICNRRLEVFPYKEWELESIHSLEVLDMIRGHVGFITGLRPDSSVARSRETRNVSISRLASIYVDGISYGYFLKSVTLRYRLERILSLTKHDQHIGHRTGPSLRGSNAVVGYKGDIQSAWTGSSRGEEEIGDFECYVDRIQSMKLQIYDQLRSKEAVHLVKSHSEALFGNVQLEPDGDGDLVLASLSTLRRVLMEAIAFGSFLWDTENFIGNIYKLEHHEAE